MPRTNARRFTYSGPWTGLNEQGVLEQLSPGVITTCKNMEMYGGALRPRRGVSVLTSDAMGSAHATVNLLRTMVAVPDPVDPQNHDLLVQGRTTGDLVCFWRYTSTASPNAWTAQIGGEFACPNTHHRATYAPLGGWMYVALSTQQVAGGGEQFRLFAYRKAVLTGSPHGTDVFRRVGLGVWTNGNPTVAVAGTVSGGGELTVGRTYYYKITYYDQNTLVESDLSAVILNATVAAGENSVAITVTDAGWPARYYEAGATKTATVATHIRIYRLDPGLNDYHYVTTFGWDDTRIGTQSFTDGVADRSTGQIHMNRRGLPPISCAYIAAHKDRLFLAVEGDNTVWFSEPTEQDTGRSGAEYFPSDNWFELPEGGRITAIKSFGEQLLVFQELSVWLIDSETLPSPIIRKLPSASGAGSQWLIAETFPQQAGQRLYWANVTGVFEYDGSQAQMLSASIPETYRQIVGSPWSLALGSASTHMYFSSALFDYWRQRYIISVTLSGAAGNHMTILCYHINERAWSTWTMPNPTLNVYSLVNWIDLTHNVRPMLGTQGLIYYLSSAEAEYFTDPSAAAIDWSFETGWIDFGDRHGRKHLYDVYSIWSCDSGAAGVSVTLDVYVDRNGTASKSEAFTLAAGENILKTHVGVSCRFVRIKLSAASAPARMDFITWGTEWEPRRLRVA